MRYQLGVSLVCSALVSTLLAAQSADVPIPVSPGELQQAVALSGRCPTFSWGAVDGAPVYELAVYAIGSDEIESDPVLRKRIPGSALSWTPALADCLRSPGRYAWVIRALGKELESRWSSPRLFEIAARPSAEELEAALEIVRRYIEAEEGDSTTVTPDGEGTVEDGASEPKRQENPQPSALGGAAFSVDSSGNVQGLSFSGLWFSGSGSNADAIIEGSNEGSGPGVSGDGDTGPGLFGESDSGSGVLGDSTSGIGVYGEHLTSGNFGYLGSDGNGVFGSSASGIGVYGKHLTSDNFGYLGSESNGVFGSSTSGAGVSGSSQSAAGVIGASQSKVGVQGHNLDTGNYGELGTVNGGVYGEVAMSGTYGVAGKDTASGNLGYLGTDSLGVFGQSGTLAGVEGKHTSGNWGQLGTASNGVYGESGSGNYGGLGGGGLFGAFGASENGTGVYGESSTGVAVEGLCQTSGNTGQLGTVSYGVRGEHDATGNIGQLGALSFGVYGETPVADAGNYGAYGKHTVSGNYGYHGSSTHGMYGYSQDDTAAAGASDTGVGVSGSSTTGTAVEGHHLATSNYGELGAAGYGVQGKASIGSSAVYGVNLDSNNHGSLGTDSHGVLGKGAPYAGWFDGNLHVTGTLSKGGGTFVQPHREDPAREIQYAFFEGPEHAVFFRGTSRLEKGRATIELPEHFRVVAAEEGVQVQATPIEECHGLYVTGQGRERIEIKELMGGQSDARFNYFVTAVRAGFEHHEPIVANTHFKPQKGESVGEFEARFSNDDISTKALRSMLVANGLLTKDGRLNMAMVKKLEWEVVEESRSDSGSGMPAVASR